MLARNTYDRSAALSGYNRDAPTKAVAAIPEEYDLDDDDDIEEDDDLEYEARTPQVLKRLWNFLYSTVCLCRLPSYHACSECILFEILLAGLIHACCLG